MTRSLHHAIGSYIVYASFAGWRSFAKPFVRLRGRRGASLHCHHPERMEIIQPRVARNELPWVDKSHDDKELTPCNRFVHRICKLRRVAVVCQAVCEAEGTKGRISSLPPS